MSRKHLTQRMFSGTPLAQQYGAHEQGRLFLLEDTFIRLVKQKQSGLDMTQSMFAQLLGLEQSTLSCFYERHRSPKVAAAVGVAFPDLKDAALRFLLEEMPTRMTEAHSASIVEPAR